MWVVTRGLGYDEHELCFIKTTARPAVFDSLVAAQELRTRLSMKFPQQTYNILSVDLATAGQRLLKLQEKHRRATKHIQQLVTHPIASEITGKMHMRLRSAETALRWTQTHMSNLRDQNQALSRSLQWALATLAGSWIVFIAVILGAKL